MKVKTSFRKQLFRDNIMASIIPMIILGVISMYLYGAVVKEKIHNYSDNTADVIETKVNNYVKYPVKLLGNLRGQIAGGSIIDNRELQKTLNTVHKLYPYFTSIEILDNEGDVVLLAPESMEYVGFNLPFDKFYNESSLADEPTWTNIYISTYSDEPTMAVGLKMDDKMIVGEINIRELNKILKVDMESDVESMSIVDSKGTYLVDKDYEKIEMRMRYPDFDAIIEESQNKDKQEKLINLDNHNDSVIMVSHIDSVDWYIIIHFEKKIIYSDLYKGVYIFISIILGSLIMSLILINKKSEYLTKSLDDLTNKTLIIASGEYELEMEHSPIKEFELLTNGITKMAYDINHREEEIKAINSSLEELVTKRTEQLIVVNSSLEEMNAVLEEEIDEKTGLEEELRAINEELENIVQTRTAELVKTNAELQEMNTTLEEEVDEKTRAQEDLNRSEEKFRNAIEDSPVPIMLHADDGEVIALSSAWTEITGYSLEEIPTSQIWTQKAYGEKAYEINNSNKLLFELENRVYEGEFEILTKNKENKIWGFHSTRIGKLQDGRRMVMSVGVDLTSQKQFEHDLFQAIENAQDSNHSKGQFLANMSHEIRTPMNGIIGMLEVLNLTNLDDNQLEYLSIIKDSSKSLLNILNDILDYSKIEAGKLELSETRFDLNKSLNNLVSLFRASIHNQNLELNFDIDPKIPENIIGDVTKIQQILSNLIGNAIKFTEEGEINVKALLIGRVNGIIKIKIIVDDTGIGMRQSALDNIFNRFSQLDEAGKRRSRGTGLGLAITKALVEKMDGKIEANSEFGVGSSFVVTLVLKETKDIIMDINDEMLLKVELEKLKGLKVLVVEDDFVSAKMINILFEKKGLIIDIAYSGEEAIERVKENKYDLVLMDINLPGINGFETTKAIRGLEFKNEYKIPIIAMTANALEGDKERCITAGMDDYLTKPIEIDNAIYVVAQYCNKDISNLRSVKRESEVSNMMNFNSNLEQLMNSTGFDEETSLELLAEYSNYARVLVNDIQKCLIENSMGEVKRILHQLKGSSGNLRIKEIYELAEKGEEIAMTGDYSKIVEVVQSIDIYLKDISDMLTKRNKEVVSTSENNNMLIR